MVEGRHAEALERWNDLMAHDPEPDRYRRARGITYLLLGEPRAAEADFVAARQWMDPRRPRDPFVGVALWLQDEPEEAGNNWIWEVATSRIDALSPVDEAGLVQGPALLFWAAATQHPGLRHLRSPAIRILRQQAQ